MSPQPKKNKPAKTKPQPPKASNGSPDAPQASEQKSTNVAGDTKPPKDGNTPKRKEKTISERKDAVERRTASRLTMPHTSEAGKHVQLGKNKPKKKFSLDFLKKIPAKLDVMLPKQPDQTQKKRKQELKNKLTQTDANSPFNFSFSPEDSKHDEVHQTIAVSFPGLAAGCTELKKAMHVKDISTTGVGLFFEKPRVKGGTILTLMLATKKQKLASGIKSKVMRHENGVIGARFQDLSRQQENILSKLVLEGQKLQGRLRKKRKLPKEIEDIKI